MKISDFIHQFPAGVSADRFGLCRVRVFIKPGEEPVALLTAMSQKSLNDA